MAFPVVCRELEAGQEHVLCLRGAAAAQPQTVGGMAQTTGTPPGGAGPPGSSEELESWRSFRFLNAFGQLKSTRNTEQPWTDSYVIKVQSMDCLMLLSLIVAVIETQYGSVLGKIRHHKTFNSGVFMNSSF